MSTISNALWYIDPHRPKFASRSVKLPSQLDQLHGFNDPLKGKKKVPPVSVSEFRLNKELKCRYSFSNTFSMEYMFFFHLSILDGTISIGQRACLVWQCMIVVYCVSSILMCTCIFCFYIVVYCIWSAWCWVVTFIDVVVVMENILNIKFKHWCWFLWIED